MPTRVAPKKRRKNTTSSESPDSRLRAYRKLRQRLTEIPKTFLRIQSGESDRASVSKTTECQDYAELVDKWKGAMRWREDMQFGLDAMLAVILSTEQMGDQLFLMIIGSPGSGKTRLCDAVLTSDYCYPVESVTGFHSGWRGDGDEDYSLIGRIDRKTMITPEADTLVSSPSYAQIMSQTRRIFDGAIGASYKNMKEDKRYDNLRTPWIMAGTHALLDSDQSRLGDRFLKLVIDKPGRKEIRRIQRTVFKSALSGVQTKSTKEGVAVQKLADVYAMTGGYVDYLRENTEQIFGKIEVDVERFAPICEDIGEFISDFRARPSKQNGSEAQDDKEMPTRLTAQFTRMMVCLAGVKAETQISDGTVDTMLKMSIDTCKGKTLDIAECLFEEGEALTRQAIARRTNMPTSNVSKLVRFMRSSEVGILELSRRTKEKYQLTERSADLMEKIIEGNYE